MRDNNHKTKHRGSTLVWSIVLTLTLIYVLCPALLILPVILIYGGPPANPVVAAAINKFFSPASYLYENIPAYRRFIDAEYELLGFH